MGAFWYGARGLAQGFTSETRSGVLLSSSMMLSAAGPYERGPYTPFELLITLGNFQVEFNLSSASGSARLVKILELTETAGDGAARSQRPLEDVTRQFMAL
jgi:hypothetical protein